MRILFLDHDGVICLCKNWGSRYFKSGEGIQNLTDDFDEGCIKILNEIITETDCEIVVSSDWRLYFSLEELQELYRERGVLKVPIDITPYFGDFQNEIDSESYRSSRGAPGPIYRAIEINQYIKKHPVEGYCAVDDMFLQINKKVRVENFVKTKECVGIKEGKIKEKIIELLIKNQEKDEQ